jgi:hypothetical protein
LCKKSHISGNPEAEKLVLVAITTVLLGNIISCCGVTEYCLCAHREETANTPESWMQMESLHCLNEVKQHEISVAACSRN